MYKTNSLFACALAILVMYGCNDDTGSSVATRNCDIADKINDSCSCNETTGTWENCDKPSIECNDADKTSESCTCNETTGTWENCDPPSLECNDADKTSESCTCNPSTGTWEKCEKPSLECNDADKTSETCTCNETTGTWENCDKPSLECNDADKTSETCTCNPSTGTWENCDPPSLECNDADKTNENCICDTTTGKWDCQIVCVDADACSIGETHCGENDNIRQCVKNEQTGCNEWSEFAPCPDDRPLCIDNGSSANCYNNPCGYENSDECFSIILIPDTQGYTRDCNIIGNRDCEQEDIDEYCDATKCGVEDCSKKKVTRLEKIGINITVDKCKSIFGSDLTEEDEKKRCRKLKSGCGPDEPEFNENNTYVKQMQWIADNEKRYNIKAAIHLGDITDDNLDIEWKIADKAHENLDKSGIPYSISTGNHDYRGYYWADYRKYCGQEAAIYTREVSGFNEYFGNDRYKNKTWYHASDYPGNSYITFEVGELKFLVFALEYAPRQDVLNWANEVLNKEEYKNYYVIVETHSYLANNAANKENYSDSVFGKNGYDYSGRFSCGGKGYVTHGSGGYDVFKGLVARHNNIFMVVSGHIGDSECRVKPGFEGNNVIEMAVDYAFEGNNTCNLENGSGHGWMRRLTFDLKNRKIQAMTFSAESEDKTDFYCSSYEKNNSESDHKFDIPFDFNVQMRHKSDNNYLGFAMRDINSDTSGDHSHPAAAMSLDGKYMVAVWVDDSGELDETKNNMKKRNIKGRIFESVGRSGDGGEFMINDFENSGINYKNGDQMMPDAAMDKDGNFVVVWADDVGGDGGYDVWMRGFSKEGKQIISPICVHGDVILGQQQNPAIAMNSSGSFVVVWGERIKTGENPTQYKTSVWMRVFPAGKQEEYSKQLVAENIYNSTDERIPNPDVAIDGAGNFVVTWEAVDENNNSNIIAQGFNADGTPRLEKFKVNRFHGEHHDPSIGMNEDGIFYITYTQSEDLDEKTNEVSNKFNTADELVYSVRARGYGIKDNKLNELAYFRVSNTKDGSATPAICVNSNEEAIIAWRAFEGYKIVNNNLNNKKVPFYNIKRRAYMKNGESSGVEDSYSDPTHTVNLIPEWVQDQPAIACTNAGQSVILWRDDMDTNGKYNIYGRGYNEVGLLRADDKPADNVIKCGTQTE